MFTSGPSPCTSRIFTPMQNFHGRGHGALVTATLIRLVVISSLAVLGACAGSGARIGSRPAMPVSLPVVAEDGPSDARQEQRLLAQALDDHTDSRDDASLVAAVRRSIGTTALIAGNRVELLLDGPSTFRQFAQAIADAEHHIHVETFIFADDSLGRSFAELLIAKQHAGVEVRVVYDSIGSWVADPQLFERMRAAGIQVLAYRPLDSIDDVLSGRINQRDHRKILIVDGRIAFVGGINISGTYNLGSDIRPGATHGLERGWRDTHVRITGPVVQQFQALFFATWAHSSGDLVTPDAAYFPPALESGSALVAALASQYGGKYEAAIHAVTLAAIGAATRRVWLTQAYFTPDKSLRQALGAAARRGVDVRVLLPGFSDSRTVLQASRAIYAELLADGVRIFEYDAALMHAKTAVFDDGISSVGSANMDFRSLLDNNEVTAVIVDADFAAALAAAFERDLNNATAIDPVAWQKRPLPDRIAEEAARLIWRWL